MLVAKYKFDKSIYSNLIPVFNDGYEGYSISDEIDSENSNHVIRTIECDTLPTLMRFGKVPNGQSEGNVADNRTNSLLEILNMDTTYLIDLSSMFRLCTILSKINCDWNTSNVNNMTNMFHSCNNLTSLDVSNFDTSNVTNMGYMFYDCNKLTTLDVSNFDTSNVTTMQSMFRKCDNLTLLNLSNFNTKNVTNMHSMFLNCTNLTSMDISNFDTSNVIDTTNIFVDTSSLQYIRCNNVSTINTLASLLPSRTSSTQGKIITTSSTNVDTTTLSSLNWSVDTSSGTKIAEYVYDKSIWNYLVPEFNEGYSGYFCNDVIEDEVNNPNVVTRELVGYGGLPTLMRFGREWVSGENTTDNRTDSLLEILDMNTSELTNCNSMFRFNKNLISITCEWNTSNVTDMQYMFSNCNKLTSLDVSNWDTSEVTDMYGIFNGCTNLTSLDVSSWDTGNVTNMYGMFNNCTNLTSLDVSNFDTNKVTTMKYMFGNCHILKSLDLSNFNTSNVTNMENMFRECNNLTSLDVSNWDTSKVTNMAATFRGCQSLTLLDVSNWNTSNVTNMTQLFRECTSLTSLDVSNWNTSNVTDMYTIFYQCQSLTSLDVSNFDTNKVIDMRMMFNITSKLSDIGMLYCSQDTINTIISLITNGSKTIWVKDTKASDYTATDYVTFKDYKENNRTLYLNSPLLEGDEIVNKEGKLYHYHKMRSVVLNGSENWVSHTNGNCDNNESMVFLLGSYLNNRLADKYNYFCENLEISLETAGVDCTKRCIMLHPHAEYNGHVYIRVKRSDLKSQDLNGFKQWLQANPTTVVYELAEPYYELISDDPLIVKSYAEGKLDTSSIITPTSIQSIPYEEELTYLYTSTQYCIQFNSTANCTVDITLGGTKVENKSVSVGLNKIYITTPSTLVDNKLIINAKGSATISEVVVVNSNAEFDYFDGLKSSFEDCLVTDVDSENYGKYEVGVKIVGKNKFNKNTTVIGSINITTGNDSSLGTNRKRSDYIAVSPNTAYTISQDYNIASSDGLYLTQYNSMKEPIMVQEGEGSAILSIMAGKYTFITKNNTKYIRFRTENNRDLQTANIQIEEGDTATAYEPYKETNATIYLNSPLLKGDRIEVVDGKLCHYHKMRSVVLDGNENWRRSSVQNKTHILYYTKDFTNVNYPLDNNKTGGFLLSDCYPRFVSYNNLAISSAEGVALANGSIGLNIARTRLSDSTIPGFQQWLQANPTTVVYGLAEPYYEDITPIQSSFVISTVSEGDMEILTDLPIKSNITYLTNITSAVLMEQQLDELDNSTESLTNIVEDEINE